MTLPIGSSMSSSRAFSAEGRESLLAAWDQLSAKYKAGNFDEQVQRFLGSFDQASQKTNDLIWALHGVSGMTQPRTKDGVYGIHIEDMARDRDKALQAFTRAAGSLFQDYGIDTTKRIDFTVGSDGRIRVKGGHPDADKIEELVNGSFLMRNTIVKVLNDSALVERVHRGPDGADFDDADLILSLLGDDGEMDGVVRMFNDLLASTSKKKQEDAKSATLKELLESFDKQHVEHQKALDAEQIKARQAAAQQLLAQQSYQNAYIHQLMADREHAARQGEVPPVTTTGPTFI